jgi:hypothetical protein
VVERTSAFLADPAHGFTHVAVIERVPSSEAAAVALDERGIAAVRLPAAPAATFPEAQRATDAWLNALGELDSGPAAFAPAYGSFFPEASLTRVGSVQIAADLAPFMTVDAQGGVHGRNAHGMRSPEVWAAVAPFDSGAFSTSAAATREQLARARAKWLLRAIAAYAGKGAARVDVFSDRDPVSSATLVAAEEPDGGLALTALRRLLARFAGPAAASSNANVRLEQVSSCSSGTQFIGDGTAAHPTLYDRDVVAWLPFVVGDGHLEAVAYVMTRNLARTNAGAGPSDPQRFDLPPEPFTLTLRVSGASPAIVEGYDPIADAPAPVSVVERSGDRLTLTLPLSDAPVVISLRDR